MYMYIFPGNPRKSQDIHIWNGVFRSAPHLFRLLGELTLLLQFLLWWSQGTGQAMHGKFGNVKKSDPESINLVVVQGIPLFFHKVLKPRGWVKTDGQEIDGFGNKQMRQNSINTTRNWIPGIWSLRPTPPHFGTFLVKMVLYTFCANVSFVKLTTIQYTKRWCCAMLNPKQDM